MADPFFIVGNDRSGTTMLRFVLDRGPDAAIPPESMFLTDLAPWRERRGLDDPETAARFMRQVWRHPKVRLWGLPPEPPAIPAGLSHEEAYRFAVEAPFRAYAAKDGKARWGDKTPHYVHHVDALLEVWPAARFVVMVRDGRDVALSVRRLPFGPNNAWAAAQWWARGIRAGIAAQERHPEHVRTVRYEDVVRDPVAAVAAICGFLGLRYDDDMLALDRADRSRVVATQRSWFPTLFDGINDASLDRWTREMPARDQAVFEALAGDELLALGYRLTGRDGAGLTPLRERWYRRHNEVMRNVNFVRLRVVQERGSELAYALRRRIGDPVARGR